MTISAAAADDDPAGLFIRRKFKAQILQALDKMAGIIAEKNVCQSNCSRAESCKKQGPVCDALGTGDPGLQMEIIIGF